MQVRYLTQLNTKPRILKWYTPGELILVMGASFLPFVVEIVLGLTPNIFVVLVLWAIFTTIIAAFRVGRPEGYLVHLLQSLSTPDTFRVGGSIEEPRNYPVAELYKDRS